MPLLLLALLLAAPSSKGWGVDLPPQPPLLIEAGAARDLPARAHRLADALLSEAPPPQPLIQALARLIRGLAAYRLGDYAAAAADLEAVEGLALEDAARFFEAEARFHAGDYAEAERRYRALLKDHPRSLWRHRAVFRIADALHGQAKSYAAGQALSEALKAYPEFPHPVAARMMSAQIERQRGRPRAEAPPLQEIIEIWPAEAAEAQAALEALKVQGITPKPTALNIRYARAKELRRRKYWPEAAALLQGIIDDRRADRGLKQRARMQLGRTYLQMERFEAAHEVFAALSQDGGGTGKAARLWDSRALSGLGRVDEAIATLKAREREPDKRPSVELKAQLGELYFAHGRYAEAETYLNGGAWTRAWLAYRQGRYAEALEGFERLRRGSSNNAKRYGYWAGRALARLGRVEEAVTRYREVIARFPSTYYALQARGRLWDLGRTAPRARTTPIPAPQRPEPLQQLGELARRWGAVLVEGRAAYEAEILGERTLATIYLRAALDALRAARRGGAYRPRPFVDNRKPEDQRGEWGRSLTDKPMSWDRQTRAFLRQRMSEGLFNALRGGFEALDDQHYVRRTLRQGERPSGAVDGDPRWARYYPRPYREAVEREAGRQGIDPLLVWAFMTVESTYNPRAISRASARGLMQVMPHTGALITERMGLLNFGTPLLFEPEHTIPMAAWYIRQLLTKFHGEHLLAMAAYNAGPHRVAAWLDAKPASIYLDEFVEEIPYNEAREYAKKVLRHYALYQRIYRGVDDLNVKLLFDHSYKDNINF
ncbi:transglycosylase SLT domain-containing protein [Myxococcota bacterium]|nr:transglycosylase SLT domain-containing protein [Myxococcota bacterium]